MDSEYFSYLFSSPGEYTLELTVSYIGGIVEDTVTLTVTDCKREGKRGTREVGRGG